MRRGDTVPTSVSEYIACHPPKARKALQAIRRAIRKGAPDAEECISYMMPAYKQEGALVYFGRFREHVSFFPTASGIRAFRDALARYDVAKGTVRLPLDRPIPAALITRITKFRLRENLEKAEMRAVRRKAR